jgi:hypothetical protein
MKEAIGKGINKFLESEDVDEKQDSNFLDAFNIIGGRSSKIYIDNKIKNKERLVKTDFLHFNLKALVEYGNIYGGVNDEAEDVDEDDSYYIELDDKFHEVILKWDNGIVSDNGLKWKGWDEENNIYLEQDTKISKNFKGMIIMEVIEFQEINTPLPNKIDTNPVPNKTVSDKIDIKPVPVKPSSVFVENLTTSIKEKFKGRISEDNINKLIENICSENIQDKFENVIKKGEEIIEVKEKKDKEVEKKTENKKEENVNDKTSLKQLKEIAKEKGIKNLTKYTSKNKDQLIQLINKDDVENKDVENKDVEKNVEINDKTSLKQLKEIAKEKGIKNFSKYTSKNKDELIQLINTQI